MKVLLVDDSAFFLRAATRFLSGFAAVRDIVTAASGIEALRAVRHERPDLVLLDFNMPEMGGLETLRSIKALQPGLPVIIVSLHDTADFRAAARAAGADGYVAKPDFATGLAEILAPEATGAPVRAPIPEL